MAAHGDAAIFADTGAEPRAALLGVSPSTVQVWRHRRIWPEVYLQQGARGLLRAHCPCVDEAARGAGRRRMTVYYNEIDPFAAKWLRNLIVGGHIADGEVDERSIVDVRPADLRGFSQCHFFSGIGGWPLATRLAGIPDDYPLWTGSCPCQPFSCAGKQRGHTDERHLWPAFYALISECLPAAVAGEQVAGGLGREWLAAVRADLERLGYAVGAADLPAASVGAPHIRQRLFWLADSRGAGLAGRPEQHARPERPAAERSGDAGGWSSVEYLHCRDGKARPTEPGIYPLADGVPGRVGQLRAYGNAIVPQVAAAFLTAALA